MSVATTTPPPITHRPSARATWVFLAIAFGGAWLVWLPELLGADLPDGVLKSASMVVVGIAAFVALKWADRSKHVARDSALLPPRPTRYWVLALVLLPTLGVLALGLSALAGSYTFDLANFSGVRSLQDPATVGEQGVPAASIASMLLTILAGFVVSLPLMFCEEWGWRGVLLPRLVKHGVWPGLLLSGGIWAIWHLPGYLATGDMRGLVAFIPFVLLLGVIVGWLRLRSGSLIPAVIAHGTNNAIVLGLNGLFADAGQHLDAISTGLSGWPGWLVMAAAIAVLFSVNPLVKPKYRRPSRPLAFSRPAGQH
ncbi:MAG: CPBP family intramembrane glutamic endopeptidase [Kibdelosporangium sp.]